VKGKKGTSKHVGDESEAKVVPASNPKPPLITKWKVGVKLQGRSESDGENSILVMSCCWHNQVIQRWHFQV
jgi:hypothetical protein